MCTIPWDNGPVKGCGSCDYRSDGINTKQGDHCYQWGKAVTRDAPACGEWRGSLRDEKLNDPPMVTPFNFEVQP